MSFSPLPFSIRNAGRLSLLHAWLVSPSSLLDMVAAAQIGDKAVGRIGLRFSEGRSLRFWNE